VSCFLFVTDVSTYQCNQALQALFSNYFYPLQHAAFAALSSMLQMVQLGEMQHLCSIRGSLLKEGPHLLQMLHRAGAVLRCTFC
jgi:hypothetical protein